MKFLILIFTLFASQAFAGPAIVNGYQGNLATGVITTIGSAATASAVIPTKGFSLVGCYFPSAFTGTSISFTAGTTATGTFGVVTTGTLGTTLSYTVAASNYVAMNPVDFYGINFLKIISGSSEANARTLTCSLKGI